MSCTNFNNNTLLEDLDFASSELGDLIEEVKLSNKLNKIFSVKQLKLIEVYFEGNDGYFYENREYDTVKAFYIKYPSDKKRLQLIMENIVKNDGIFVPKKLKI